MTDKETDPWEIPIRYIEEDDWEDKPGTPFDVKCEILSDLWLNHRANEFWQEFIRFSDLGLPLAYSIGSEIIDRSERADECVEECWKLFLETAEIEEDTGFESLEDLLDQCLIVDIEIIDDEDEESEEDIFSKGFDEGVIAERARVQSIVKMQKTWAKGQGQGKDYIFWNSVGEVLTPVEVDYSEEAYNEQNERDGF